MAEGDDQDKSQKTEDATPRKLEQAREKGQVASSKEIGHAMMMLAGAIIVFFVLPTLLKDMLETLFPFIVHPHDIPIAEVDLRSIVFRLVLLVALLMSVFALFVMAAAFLGNYIQNGLLFSFETITPKLEKISVIKGLKRMFSLKSIVEFLKGLFKITIVGTLVFLILSPLLGDLPEFVRMSTAAMLHEMHIIVLLMFIGVLCVMTLLAGLDFLYQKYEFMQEMRMSRRELKDEFKQTEGDPLIKQKLRQIRQEKARQRMMADVPKADVIITNPTHFAVALKYEHSVFNAPKVLAKGVDAVALKIREVAQEHRIPIVENPPLARSLFDTVDIGEEIKFEHYKAVAEVIRYVMKLKGKLKKK